MGGAAFLVQPGSVATRQTRTNVITARLCLSRAQLKFDNLKRRHHRSWDVLGCVQWHEVSALLRANPPTTFQPSQLALQVSVLAVKRDDDFQQVVGKTQELPTCGRRSRPASRELIKFYVRAKGDDQFSILVARNWWAPARTEFLQNFYLLPISSTE
jgi:hypothetical protein